MDPQKTSSTQIIQPDAWTSLKAYTAARIALGRAGTSQPLKQHLRFKLDHAHARDAVYASLEIDNLIAGLSEHGLPVHVLKTQARDRQEYLQRPDLGRMLHPDAAASLQGLAEITDLSIIIADGLSAVAVNRHALPLLRLLVPAVRATGLSLSPLTVVTQGRVAIGDEIGSLLQAKLALVLIGERPGLSSPDSLGAYLTYGPKKGLTDDRRNCVSNIRPEGLAYMEALEKLMYLITSSVALRQSGIALKDQTGISLPPRD